MQLLDRAPDLLEFRSHSGRRTQDNQHAVDCTEHRAGFSEKTQSAGSIHQIEGRVFPVDMQDRRADGNLAMHLFRFEVGHRGPVHDRSHGGDDAGGVEEGFCERGFPRAGIGNDGDIPDRVGPWLFHGSLLITALS